MPTYDYACASCGPFATLRRIADRDLPSECPECRQPAPRVLSQAPSLAGTEASVRRMQRATYGDGTYPRMRHAAGCGCC